MKVIKSKKKAFEMQKELHDSFIEFFGCNDPVFENGKKVESALNQFWEWRNTKWKVPGTDKTPDELWLEKHDTLPKTPKNNIASLYTEKGIGIICDEEAGIGIFPEYSFVKTLFKGDYKRIRNYKELVYDLIEEPSFMDSYILKKLILENKDRAIEVFNAAYPNIKTTQEIETIMRYARKDWDDEPIPTIIPVKT